MTDAVETRVARPTGLRACIPVDSGAVSGGTRALVILGLSGLAVAQPLLDLFGKNPEFFVAGNYSRGPDRRVRPADRARARRSSAIGAHRRGDRRSTAGAGTVVFAVVVGRAGAGVRPRPAAHARRRPARRRVRCWRSSAGAGVAVLVLRTPRRAAVRRPTSPWPTCSSSARSCSSARPSELVARRRRPATSAEVEVPPPGGPVVVVVLDEFPAATIMRGDGTLNAERYPGFAELASVSTWFRNASSQYNLTHRAVPSILERRRSATTTTCRRTPTTPQPVHPARRTSCRCAATSRSPTCARRRCAHPPPRQPLSQAIEDASVVYGHRVLPSALRDELPAIDNSWGAYGAGRPGRATTSSPGDASRRRGDDARRAGVRQVARPGRRRAQPARPGRRAPRRDRRDHGRAGRCTSSTSPCRTGRGCCRAAGIATSYSPELITDPGAPGLRLRRPHGVPAAQHAGRRRRHAGRRARRPPAVAADVGGHAARRHVRPRHQPHAARHRADEGHRRQPRGGLPGAAVHQGAGPDDGEIRDDSAQNHRRAAVDRRPPRCRGRLGVRRPLALRRQRRPHRAEGVHPTSTRRSTSPRGGPRSSRYGDDWTALAAVGAHGDLVGATVDELDVGAPSAYAATLAQADALADLPTADGEVPFVLAGTVTGASSRAARAARRRQRHASPASSAATGATATAGRSPATSATSTATAPTTCTLYEVARPTASPSAPSPDAVALGQLVDGVDAAGDARGQVRRPGDQRRADRQRQQLQAARRRAPT